MALLLRPRRPATLAIGDVGQDQVEEVDILQPLRRRAARTSAGRSSRATQPFDPARPGPDPATAAVVHVLEHDGSGNCSITGGYVVRDPGLPTLFGRYVYADLCAGQLRSFVPDSAGARRQALGPSVSTADLVRRGQRRPDLRDLARRARLPARRGLSAAACSSVSASRADRARSRSRRRRSAGARRRVPRSGAGDVELEQVGTLRPAGLRHSARRAVPTGSLFVVEQRGADQGASTASGARARPSSTSPARSASGGERGLLSVAFAPDYAKSGLFYVYYTDRGGDIEIDEFRAPPGDRARDRGSRRAGARDPPLASSRTTTAASSSSAPTATSTSAPATAAAPATRARTPRTTAACSASCCGSTRPGRRAALRDPARQPIRRRGGPRRDLRHRAAQPVALLVRPRDRRVVIGDVGQDRCEEIDYDDRRSAARRELRLGPRSRATTATTPGREPAADHVPTKPIFDYSQRRRQLRGHRRLRRPRPARCRARGPLRLRRLLRRRAAQPDPRPRRRPRRRPLGLGAPTVSSFGDRRRAATSTSRRCDGPRVSRLVPG